MDGFSPGHRCSKLHVVLLILRLLVTTAAQEDITEDEETVETYSIPSEVKVTSWNDMPFSGLRKEGERWVGEGYAFYILDLISTRLNFSYSIVEPPEHVLGNEKTGILSLLYQKKVDMAVAFLPVLPETRKYCSFSTALDETRLTALMKRPQESATGSGLLAPFDNTVWILVLASLLLVGPIIYIFAFIRSKLWDDPDSENFSLLSCFWFVYSSLLKQGTNIAATTDSTRMLFATWWMFILILTSFYTANLTAFLTKPQFTLSIKNLEDIVRQGYSWITYRGRTVDFLLSQDQHNELSLLNRTRWRGNGFFRYDQPTTEILDSVSTRKLFLAEAHFLQTLIFKDYQNKTRKQMEHSLRCTYVIMPGSILVSPRAFGFPRGSTIKYLINKELQRMVEGGIIQHTKEKDLPLAEICPVDLGASERQLKNTDLLLTYKVVGAGYTVAFIIFFLEILLGFAISRIRKKNRKSVVKTRDVSLLEKRAKEQFYNKETHLANGKKHYINGRNYYVIVDGDGDRRLIPIRTPSAFLFHYAV